MSEIDINLAFSVYLCIRPQYSFSEIHAQTVRAPTENIYWDLL